MKNNQLLIIFYRNPVLGSVKTRLAATVGAERALEYYKKLVEHTRTITKDGPYDKLICYSEQISTDDIWSKADYQKTVQGGGGLGDKMSQAFDEAFGMGYQSVCLIGTDCYEITDQIIESAFAYLYDHDVVIGPATDGGYYLIGMKQNIPNLFANKRWSTDSVWKDTLHDLQQLGLAYAVLPTLSDVDEESDLPPSWR
ncbi:hypothetical protein CLV98_10392 [Dyadobacter jejuensis]|uniref:Glycosyltransferase n=1 Tax=Dyadobacter jejuensis TaxID=1082580 RepID=A0A316AMC2_9BACT|nr:TIGR04282 family arsenosugar biosynthesis glycosyltransferase [Dyadobacter jejuensis]PWJ58726.1 hypothetical protein CLV98_10392 [Dyadobacter jejuensis]